jgi:hypothetical protein
MRDCRLRQRSQLPHPHDIRHDLLRLLIRLAVDEESAAGLVARLSMRKGAGEDAGAPRESLA